MFSGIITECFQPLQCKVSDQLIEVVFPRPNSYKYLKEGEKCQCQWSLFDDK